MQERRQQGEEEERMKDGGFGMERGKEGRKNNQRIEGRMEGR